MKKYDKIITKNFLIQKYSKKNKFLWEIAKEVKCCIATIYNYLIKHNIPRRTRSETQKGIPKNKGKKCWNYIDGRTNKTYYCIDCFKKGIKTKVSDYRVERCRECADEEHSRRMTGKIVSEKTKEKMSKACKGKKHWNWQGGRTQIRRDIHTLPKYKKWRKRIFERDNYTCQKCRINNGKGKTIKLNAHHKKRISIIIKENNIKTLTEALECKELWHIKNGITLCADCHKLTFGRLKK